MLNCDAVFMLYKVFIKLILLTSALNVTIEIKATEQYFPVVLSNTIDKVVQSFESADEILKCGHSKEG